MDVVYTFKKNENCEEIIYSLRSLINLPHDRVVIVGDWPDILNQENVYYIPVEQENNKYQNTLNSLKIVCSDNKISDDFILMNDDFFILKEIKNPAEELNLYRGNAFKVYEHYVQKYGENGYSKGMLETAKLLQKMGIAYPLGYELHTPFVFNKSKFLKMFELEGVGDILALHKRTLYGNLYLKGGISMKDVKLFAFSGTNIDAEQKFVSCSDTAWANLRIYLQKMFNTKSIYEV